MKANRFIRQFAADERAVSEVIGAVLVFGILIAVLALVQTQAVPATNEEVEFQHSQKVQTDMAELNEAISLTAAQGRSMSPTMKLGMTYPARLFFFNPSPVYGQLRTNATANVTLDHVNSTEGVNLLYTGGTYNYSTRPIEYRAGYHRFADEPVIIREVGTLYERYPAGTRVQGGSFINGKQITLVTLNGTLQRNSLSAESVETVPLSAPARTVAITNKTHKINITVPTQLNKTHWESILLPNSNIDKIFYEKPSDRSAHPYNLLTVRLKKGVTYQLRMARIGMGTQLHEPPPAYLTTITGDNESVVDNGVLKVTVEVRDRFNNPVAGKEVNLSIVESATGLANGTFFPSGSKTTAVTTAADGRASVTYQPPNVLGGARDVDIRASTDSVPPNDPSASFDLSSRNNTTVDVKVVDTGGPIGDPPTPSIDDITDQSGCTLPLGPLPCEAAFEIEWSATDPNSSPNSELDIVEVRLVNDTTDRIVDSAKYDVEGTSASGEVTLFEDGDHCGKDYTIKVIASDKGGYVRETSEGKTADCS